MSWWLQPTFQPPHDLFPLFLIRLKLHGSTFHYANWLSSCHCLALLCLPTPLPTKLLPNDYVANSSAPASTHHLRGLLGILSMWAPLTCTSPITALIMKRDDFFLLLSFLTYSRHCNLYEDNIWNILCSLLLHHSLAQSLFIAELQK